MKSAAAWIIVQVIALMMAAAQLPLSANFVQPAAQWAVHEMAVAQVGAATMLFPVLLVTWGDTLLLCALAVAFLQFAALLTPMSAQPWVGSAGYVVVWLLALRCWRIVLNDERKQLVGVAIASLWAAGGVVLYYARAEFSPLRGSSRLWTMADGPILGALAVVNSGKTDLWAALMPAVVAACALLALLGLHIGRRHKLSTPVVHICL